jgi:predicted transcriptional regulator
VSEANLQTRLATKTPEAAFLHILETEFHIPPRTGRVLLETAKEILVGEGITGTLRPGQTRVVVTTLKAPFGPSLAESAKVEVTLTVDSGAEDEQVRAREGAEALRRGRILRVTEEALEQGGVLTQEDLARVLNVDRRTIERDVRALKAEAHLVSTRGLVKNVGRGQTHKVKIIELWLNREGYDKIARWVHHSPQAIKRYVSTFLRLVVLHRQGKDPKEIAFLTQISVKLVNDYLGLYRQALQQPAQFEKLEEELERVSVWRRSEPEKGGRPR